MFQCVVGLTGVFAISVSIMAVALLATLKSRLRSCILLIDKVVSLPVMFE